MKLPNLVSFYTKDSLSFMRANYKLNPKNIIHGNFFNFLKERRKEIDLLFADIKYNDQSGIFMVIGISDEAIGIPTQFISDDMEFYVIFNDKKYTDLQLLYLDYHNFLTCQTIDNTL